MQRMPRMRQRDMVAPGYGMNGVLNLIQENR